MFVQSQLLLTAHAQPSFHVLAYKQAMPIRNHGILYCPYQWLRVSNSTHVLSLLVLCGDIPQALRLIFIVNVTISCLNLSLLALRC